MGGSSGAGAGGALSAVGSMPVAVHVIAAEVPWRVLREVGSRFYSANFKDEATVVALSTWCEREKLVQWSRRARECLEAFTTYAPSGVCLTYSLMDDKFDAPSLG
ncbi:hypothetical protein EON66_11055 [archaeon]|nr:MAG: hypothetical protein EON66_11055 [archaeon]